MMSSSVSARLLLRILRKYHEPLFRKADGQSTTYASPSAAASAPGSCAPQPSTAHSASTDSIRSLAQEQLSTSQLHAGAVSEPTAAACGQNLQTLHFMQQQGQPDPGLLAQEYSSPLAIGHAQDATLSSAPRTLIHCSHSSISSSSIQPWLSLPGQHCYSSSRSLSSTSSSRLGRRRHRRRNKQYAVAAESSEPDWRGLDTQTDWQWKDFNIELSSTSSRSPSSSGNLEQPWLDQDFRDDHSRHTPYRSTSPTSFASRWFSSSSSWRADISASCDVPLTHPLRQRAADADRSAARQDAGSSSSASSSSSRSAYDDWRPWPFAKQIQGGNIDPKVFNQPGQVLSQFYTEGTHGGLGRRFRRKVPLFEVIEYYANGTAVEQYKPRTPQQLGLHPRDVVLFAPLSRLAAPQRATIVVHDGKILVKTEIVKAIITADKAILIKGRRDADTQKLSQNILAANDQRLMAINMHLQQLQQQEDIRASQSLASHGCGKAPSAAEVIKSSRATVPHRSGVTHDWDAEDGWLPKGGGELRDVPFEMLVLEVLLDATTEYFYTKVQHLNWMLESIAADIRQPGQPQGAMDKAHQLIPIQKFLTSVKNDVKETSAAVKAALESNETLEELCLSWHLQQQQQQRISSELAKRRRLIEEGFDPDDDSSEANYSMIYGQGYRTSREHKSSVGPAHQVRMLTEMLESYEREIQSLEGSINEAEEDLDNTRALWHMQLDSSRNHIIMVNLWLSMLNISVMASTILPAFFGMNLEGPMSSTDAHNFFLVCGGSIALAALSYPASRFWYTHNWRKINQNRIFEHKMLRVLLVQHIEDLDAIIRAVQRVRHQYCDRRMFRQLLLGALGNRAMTPAHMDFLFQCYERDRDGFIEEAQMIRPLNTYHTTLDTPPTAAAAAADSTSATHSEVVPYAVDLAAHINDHSSSLVDAGSSSTGSSSPPGGGYFAQLDQAHEEKLQSWESLIASESTRSSRHKDILSSTGSSRGNSSDSSSSSDTSGSDSDGTRERSSSSSSSSSSSESSMSGFRLTRSRSEPETSDDDDDQDRHIPRDQDSDSDGDFRVERGSLRRSPLYNTSNTYNSGLNSQANRDQDDPADYQSKVDRDGKGSDSDDDSDGSSRRGGRFSSWMTRGRGGGRQQQQQQGKAEKPQKGKGRKPRTYPGSWMDDPRFNWD